MRRATAQDLGIMRSPSPLISTALPATPRRANGPKRLCLLLAVMALAAVPGLAVNRVVRISVPASAAAGSKLTIPVLASTDAGGGEHIGFFHAEFSTDGGKTWTAICYEEKAGPKATRFARLIAGGAGSKILVRVRIAFRGGAAGDVDYKGAAIDWTIAWENWQVPPAKIATISVVAR